MEARAPLLMFHPPRCPHIDCEAHLEPACYTRFFVCKGFYRPKCRAHPVPRFRCRRCGRGFSRQTFRMDYCDNKPHLNVLLFKLLASGLGLRQTGRVLVLSRRCVELKARKVSKHLRLLNRNLTRQFPCGSRFMVDELETFEGIRATLPVAVPFLIESRSLFVVATDVATLRPRGPMTPSRRRAIASAQRQFGPRQDRSRSALQRVFRRLRYLTQDLPHVEVHTDAKLVYRGLIERCLSGRERHVVTAVADAAETKVLQPINTLHGIARDLVGRLRRKSWLVSKQRRFLRLQPHLFTAWSTSPLTRQQSADGGLERTATTGDRSTRSKSSRPFGPPSAFCT